MLVVAGAMLLSVDSTLRYRGVRLRLAALMVVASLVMSASSVLFKYFAVHDDYWITTFWTFVGEALFGAAILAVPKYWKQFTALFRKSPGAVIAINGANELINLGGGLGVRYAYLSVPVALVSAVSSTTTLFVFAFGLLLTLFFPRLGREDLSPRNLMQKGAAALLVAAGVAVVNLAKWKTELSSPAERAVAREGKEIRRNGEHRYRSFHLDPLPSRYALAGMTTEYSMRERSCLSRTPLSSRCGCRPPASTI